MINREFNTKIYDNGMAIYNSSVSINQEKFYMNVEKMLNGYNHRMDKELYALISLLRMNQSKINQMLGDGIF